MVAALTGKKVAFLVANEGVEQVELVEPWEAVQRAGGEPVLLAPTEDEVQAFNHLDKADTFQPDLAVAGADIADYQGLVLPGGVANPDQLRTDDASVAFVAAFLASGKPVASICHAPWTLVEAGALDGRTLTSWPSLRTDITNAGGDWIDEEVVIDANLITSRRPDDLPAFCSALVVAIHDASPSLV